MSRIAFLFFFELCRMKQQGCGALLVLLCGLVVLCLSIQGTEGKPRTFLFSVYDCYPSTLSYH